MHSITFDISQIKKHIRALMSPTIKADNAYKYVMVKYENSKLYFHTYNSFFAIQCDINIVSNNSFECICIEAYPLFNIIQMATGLCSIEYSSGAGAVVKLNNAVYKIPTMSLDEFGNYVCNIDIFNSINEDGYKFSVNYLKHKISCVAHCLSTDSSIPSLQHLYVYKSYLLACNGCYGALTKIDTNSLDGLMLNSHALTCINNMQSEQIRISGSDSIVFGDGDDIRFACYVANVGKYPVDEISEIINKFKFAKQNSVVNVQFSATESCFALGRLIPLSDKFNNTIVVSFDSDRIIFIVSSGHSKGKEFVESVNINTGIIKLNLDGKVFMKMLSVFDTDIFWYTLGVDDVQYITDDDTMQFFRKQDDG